MRGQGHQRQHGDEYGIPIEDADPRTEFEIRPERFKEIAGGIQWHSPHHVAQCRSEKHRQQKARSAENDIEEILPHPVFDVGAEFNADAAENEQPQHNRQRQIKSAKTRGIEPRESKVECAAGSEQPNFVAIPDGADGAQHLASLVVGLGCKQINHTRAQIETVEHDIGRDHHCDNPEPKPRHIHLASAAGWSPDRDSLSANGPRSISRRIRNRPRMPSTVYIPINPNRVNMPFPAETNLE